MQSPVETVTSRLYETRQHFAKQGGAFIARTREAGVAFLGETGDAGRHLLGAVEAEAKRWKRYAALRGSQARSGMTIQSAEKAILTELDRTLRAVDARIRRRLAQLDRRPAAGKSAKGKSAKNGRKSKQAATPLAA